MHIFVKKIQCFWKMNQANKKKGKLKIIQTKLKI